METQAAQFTLQGMGPILHWLTLVILCVLPIVGAVVLYKLGSLPGAIARARNHPQADAISICGWMGIVTLVLWPVAMVWAHIKPAGAPGTSAPADEQGRVLDGLNRAAQRLATIETRLQPQSANEA